VQGLPGDAALAVTREVLLPFRQLADQFTLIFYEMVPARPALSSGCLVPGLA
jgi:hypothetical protein